MSVPDDLYRHALTCLRLAAECRNLADDVPTPGLKERFLSMARMWDELAHQPDVENEPPDA